MEELDSYFQLHQVSEREAIRVAALHLKGMTHNWWFNSSSSFYHANKNTYAGFTTELVKIFDTKHYKTSLVETKNFKPLHELERSILPNPLHIFDEGDKNMHGTLPRARSPYFEEPSSIGEDMEKPPSREE